MNEETFRFPRFALSMPGVLQTKHPPSGKQSSQISEFQVFVIHMKTQVAAMHGMIALKKCIIDAIIRHKKCIIATIIRHKKCII